MTAARELRDGLADIAIYWDGGVSGQVSVRAAQHRPIEND